MRRESNSKLSQAPSPGSAGVARAVNIPEESVWFYLNDLPAMNIMEWAHHASSEAGRAVRRAHHR